MQHSLSIPPVGFQPTCCTLGGIPAPADEHPENITAPLTAALRGPAWMARWGCPDFCVVPHGEPLALECHSTAPVETSLLASDMDCSGYSENGESLPWLTAQVIVHDDQADSRRTQIWMGYGLHLAEISPAEARKALDELRAFTTRLAAVVDLAEQVAADDTEASA